MGIFDFKIRHKGKLRQKVFASLFLHLIKINCLGKHPWRSSRLKASYGKPKLQEAFCQLFTSRKARWTAVLDIFAYDNPCPQKNAGG